jgi:hypothetical protein
MRCAAAVSPEGALAEFAVAWEIRMSNRPNDSINGTHLPKNREVARERQPDMAVLIVALFAGGALICTALIAPILLAAVTEMTQPSGVTYQQCGAVRQDPSRLACYDRVLRRISRHSAKDAQPMVSGEILAERPDRR